MKILGTGSALPKMTLTNDMLTQYFDTSDAWISSRTGIKQRQVITDEHLDELAARASLAALENASLTVDDLDFIITSNVLDEYISPSLGCRVQGLINAHCPCFNVNGACAGFVYTLSVAEAYLKCNLAKHILVVAAEMPTRMVDWTERGTAVLFGDAAGAVVLGQGDNLKALRLATKSATPCLYQKQDINTTPFDAQPANKKSALHMEGREVFRMAVTAAMNDIHALMDECHLDSKDIQHYVLHQANERILDSICLNLKEDHNKFHQNISHTGNTSSASIPVLLDELNRAGTLKEGDNMILSAFGAGFSTGSCLMQW